MYSLAMDPHNLLLSFVSTVFQSINIALNNITINYTFTTSRTPFLALCNTKTHFRYLKLFENVILNVVSFWTNTVAGVFVQKPK